ncbi:MAG: hydroxyisourate hydrolase [Alphaproteobacteria bacterium]|nr:hydroxyisourate hydrolase [Alphaproteobacteria bacterium]
MPKLSTHVLDTMNGRPANGMTIEFVRVDAGGPTVLGTYMTNVDGRTDRPLLDPQSYRPGRYELRFHVADYFRANGVSLPEPPFLDVATVAFGLAEADGSYHVPLLVTPWSYSTYRGS